MIRVNKVTIIGVIKDHKDFIEDYNDPRQKTQ